MSFGAYFTDTGCVDRHYVQHNLEARQMGVPYSGERILADCWAEQLVTSTLRFWAYRYDQTGDEIDFWLRLVLWLLLLYDMVHVTLHTVYIREPSLFGGPRQQQVLALTGPKWPTVIHRIVRYSMVLRRKYQLPKTKLRRLISRRFLLLECPTWLLPVLCDVLESRLTAPQWMILLAGSQLVVLLRAFLESEAFAIAEKLVFAISSSIGQIAGLCLVIGISTIAMTSVHGQLFGIFHFETAGGLGTWPNLWLEIFNVLIAGAAVDPELFAFNPWGVAMMYLCLNLFLYLIMSQVFIAILVASFDSAVTRESLKSRDLSVPPPFEDCSQPRSWALALFHFPVYLLTSYDIVYGANHLLLLEAVCESIQKAEAADDAAADNQVMISVPQLTTTVCRIRRLKCMSISEAAAIECVQRLAAAHGAWMVAGVAAPYNPKTSDVVESVLDVEVDIEEDARGGGYHPVTRVREEAPAPVSACQTGHGLVGGDEPLSTREPPRGALGQERMEALEASVLRLETLLSSSVSRLEAKFDATVERMEAKLDAKLDLEAKLMATLQTKLEATLSAALPPLVEVSVSDGSSWA